MTTQPPRWLCDRCNQPVTPTDDGFIGVAYEDARASYAGPPAPWDVLHDRCHPVPADVTHYAIPVARVLTWQQVDGWTVHLSRKRWFDATVWATLTRAAGARLH